MSTLKTLTILLVSLGFITFLVSQTETSNLRGKTHRLFVQESDRFRITPGQLFNSGSSLNKCLTIKATSALRNNQNYPISLDYCGATSSFYTNYQYFRIQHHNRFFVIYLGESNFALKAEGNTIVARSYEKTQDYDFAFYYVNENEVKIGSRSKVRFLELVRVDNVELQPISSDMFRARSQLFRILK